MEVITIKLFRKIILTACALAPFIALLAVVIGSVGAAEGTAFLPLGDVAIIEGVNGVTFVPSPDTWADRIITPLVGSQPVGGLYGALGSFCVWLEAYAGIPVSFPLILSVLMLAYCFFVEFLSAVLDVLTFVPRKCLEVFR